MVCQFVVVSVLLKCGLCSWVKPAFLCLVLTQLSAFLTHFKYRALNSGSRTAFGPYVRYVSNSVYGEQGGEIRPTAFD